MNNVHDGATSQRIQFNKKYFEDLFILHISQLGIKIKFESFLKRCAMESSTKSVQTDLNCKTKKSSKYFLLNLIRWEVAPF